MYYWSDDDRIHLPVERIAGFDLLYVHGRYGGSVDPLAESHTIDRGNALIYDGVPRMDKINEDYTIDSFDGSNWNDYIHASDIIKGSGENDFISMSPERIRALTRQPVYDADLWIFVTEKKTAKPVSIGICVYDDIIGETELEWIFVHRDHHGRGVGTMLVQEIIRRSAKKSKIIRVGGIADNFYMKCGFTIKTDPWLWVKRKNKEVSWWD